MPKFFNDPKNIEKVSGVYIPFWLFSIERGSLYHTGSLTSVLPNNSNLNNLFNLNRHACLDKYTIKIYHVKFSFYYRRGPLGPPSGRLFMSSLYCLN